MNATEGFDCRPDKQEVLQFDGNTSWRAMDHGAFLYQANITADIAKIHPLTISGLECVYNHECLRIGNVDSVTLNDLTCISGYKVNTGRLECVHLDQNHDFTANRYDVFGTRLAFSLLQPGYANLSDPNWATFNGKKADGSLSRIDANIGIAVERDNHNQPHKGSVPNCDPAAQPCEQSHGTITVRDTTMTAENTGGSVPYYFYFISRIQDGIDTTVKWQWLNFNVNGKDSEVFAPESGPNVAMPVTGTWVSPITGFSWRDVVGASKPMTVAEAWAQEHVAYNGGVACGMTDPKVYGFLCPQNGTPPKPPTVTSVSVTGQTAFTAIDQNAQFTATAHLSDNTTSNVTNTASWQSSNPLIASVSSSGVVTTRGAGTATISATAQAIIGTLPITVTVATPTTFQCEPMSIPTGTSKTAGTFSCPTSSPAQCPVTATTIWMCK